MHYVYKFINKNKEVLYIGKTSRLNHRLYTHFNSEMKDWKLEVDYVEICNFKDGATMSIYELYYIDLYKPKYNIDCKYKNTYTNLTLPVVEFKKYDFKTYNIINTSIKKVDINKEDIIKCFTLILNKNTDIKVSNSIMNKDVLKRIGNTINNIKKKFNLNLKDGRINISMPYNNLISLGEIGNNPFKNLNKIYVGKDITDINSDVILYIHPKSNDSIDDVIYFMSNNLSSNEKYIYIADELLAKYIIEYFNYSIRILKIT